MLASRAPGTGRAIRRVLLLYGRKLAMPSTTANFSRVTPMSNGRIWSQGEIAQLRSMLDEGGYLRALAERLDRTPEAILVKAQKMLRR
jgi:hypothetical protein